MSPIAKQIEGYPFEVALPKNLGVYGVVFADQKKSLDRRARKAKFICRAPFDVLVDVQANMRVLIDFD
jgi:mRNA interferase MazF